MKNVKVIIVEDEVLIRLLMVRYLKRLGCEIIYETGKGEDAVRFAIKEKPDLIIIDIKLHGILTGLETAIKVNETGNIPIIIMSAYNYQDEIDKLKIKNYIGFFEKPVNEEKLRLVINKIRNNEITQ